IGAARLGRVNQLRQQVLALPQPQLLVFEDLQWADVSSLLLLQHVHAALVAAPLMIVATLRTGDLLDPQRTDAIAEVRRGAAERAVPPLTRDQVEQLLRELTTTVAP